MKREYSFKDSKGVEKLCFKITENPTNIG